MNYQYYPSPGGFPHKLYDMLAYAVNCEHSSAVSWINEGRAFAIHCEQTFMMHIVPMFFNQTQFRSFTRQLNFWGFKRMSSSNFPFAWENKNFIRGRGDLLQDIERVETKGVKDSKKNTATVASEKKFSKVARASSQTTSRAVSPSESAASADNITWTFSHLLNNTIQSRTAFQQCQQPTQFLPRVIHQPSHMMCRPIKSEYDESTNDESPEQDIKHDQAVMNREDDTTYYESESKRTNQVCKNRTPVSSANFDSDEEEELGALIYKSSRTAKKMRAEANSAKT